MVLGCFGLEGFGLGFRGSGVWMLHVGSRVYVNGGSISLVIFGVLLCIRASISHCGTLERFLGGHLFLQDLLCVNQCYDTSTWGIGFRV